MFSSSGYFRGINCPYYGSGLCERGYCHFRHVKNDEKPKQSQHVPSPIPASGPVPGPSTSHTPQENVSKASTEAPASKGSLLNMVGNAIKQVQRDIEKDKVQINNLRSNLQLPSVHRKEISSAPLYKPTPISGKSSTLSRPQKVSPPKKNYLPAGIPAYKPTPIAELKKKQQASSKKVNEYDPLVNFTTCESASPVPTGPERITLPAPTAPERITLGDAGKSSGVKRPATCPEYIPGKRAKIDSRVSSEEIEAKFSEEDTEEDTRDAEDMEVQEKGDGQSPQRPVGGSDGKDAEDSITVEDSPEVKVEEDILVVEVKRTKDKPEEIPEKDESRLIKADTAQDSKQEGKEIETTDSKKSTDKTDTTDKPNISDERSKHDKHSASDSKDGDNDGSVVTEIKEEHDSVPNTKSKDDQKDSEKENKEKKSRHHSSHDHKSAERSRKEKKSSTSDKDKDRERRKHSSSSSRHKHRHSSPQRHRSGSSSRKRSSSKKRRESSSHKHKKDRHRSKSESRSKKHKSDRHKKHKKSAKHRHRSKSRSSKKRSRHSSRSSDSSSSSSASSLSSDSESASSGASLIMLSPSQSRSPSPKQAIKKTTDSSKKSADSGKKSADSSKKSADSVKASTDSSKASPRRARKDSVHHKDSPRRNGSTESSTVRKDKAASKASSRLKSPTGLTLFEKFQPINTLDLFGEDSDNDKSSVTPLSKTTDIQTEQATNDVILLSDGDDDNGEANEHTESPDKQDDWLDSLRNDNQRHHGKTYEFKRKLVAEDFVGDRVTPSRKSSESEDAISSVGAKKRVAHLANPDAVKKQPSHSRGRVPNPSQVMLDRYKAIQAQAEASTSSPQSSASGKQRVAHSLSTRPGQTLLKKKSRTNSGSREESVTRSVTVGKDGKRTAHVPAKKVLKRPIIPPSAGSKVPTNVRQRYLNLFVDECLKLYPKEEDAYERALSEEKGVLSRASNRNIYLNVAINTVKKLRDETVAVPDSPSGEDPTLTSPSKRSKVVSHAAMLGGAKAASTNYTVNRSGGPKKLPDSLGDVEYYRLMSKYILTEEQLVENCFPRPSDIKGVATLKVPDRYRTTMSKDVDEKRCCRCGKKFVVFPEGQYARQEGCNYHWGKNWKRRFAGTLEQRYTCCDGDQESRGCNYSKYHVHEQNRYQNLRGYRSTTPKVPPRDGDWGVYAMDCEMVYTSMGSELARVTVIDVRLETVYEAMVRPQHPVLDYNSRFSGLTEDSMEGVTTTIQDVQNKLTTLFSDQTILIGHSLESDLIALKLIHNTVVDTSLVFPHRMGPPLKRALRTLMAEILQKIIQNDVGGHDSREDAVSCMELMIWKVKEDFRKASRK